MLTPVENPTAYGLVETDAQGHVTRFLEKPNPDEITCDTTGRAWAVGMFKGTVSIDSTTYTSSNDKDNDGIIVWHTVNYMLFKVEVPINPTRGKRKFSLIASSKKGRIHFCFKGFPFFFGK